MTCEGTKWRARRGEAPGQARGSFSPSARANRTRARRAWASPSKCARPPAALPFPARPSLRSRTPPADQHVSPTALDHHLDPTHPPSGPTPDEPLAPRRDPRLLPRPWPAHTACPSVPVAPAPCQSKEPPFERARSAHSAVWHERAGAGTEGGDGPRSSTRAARTRSLLQRGQCWTAWTVSGQIRAHQAGEQAARGRGCRAVTTCRPRPADEEQSPSTRATNEALTTAPLCF